jgi:hypothetical protein
VPVTEARLRSQRARLLIRNRSNELKASMANDLDAGNRVELGWLAAVTKSASRAARITQMLRRTRTARPAIMQRPGVGDKGKVELDASRRLS